MGRTAKPIINGKRECSTCKDWKQLEDFPTRERSRKGYRTNCKECRNGYLKEWREKHPFENSFWYRETKLGFTKKDFERVALSQNNVCAICKEAPKYEYRGDSFHVDHDHITGKVRGLLCSHCNRMLGCAKDNKEILANAITYLSKAEN